MNETSPPDFRDRSTVLMVFGILTILMGVLCALLVPLMLFSQAMAARDPALGNPRALIPAIGMYGGLAIAFVWLGIGSIMARRWARALLVILSWGWLLTGVISLSMMLALAPRILAQISEAGSKTSPGVPAVFMLIPLAFMVVIFLLIPGIWVAFYSGKNVRATCEFRDPAERWTDRCPLPVLAASLWIALGAPAMLAMPLVGKAVLPFFGNFLTGAPATVLCLGLAALWAWAAWGLYKLDMRAWWTVAVILVVFAISSIATYSRHDLLEVYQLMGYPPAQIEQLKKFSLTGDLILWSTIGGMIPALGYLVFIRRYFRKTA